MTSDTVVFKSVYMFKKNLKCILTTINYYNMKLKNEYTFLIIKNVLTMIFLLKIYIRIFVLFGTCTIG